MRKIVYLLAVCALVSGGCKKDSAPRSGIYGQWQWENSVGGLTGHDTIQPASGSLVTLTFNRDMTYTTTLNGQVIAHGSFQLSWVNSLQIVHMDNLVQTGKLLLWNNGESILIDNNKLLLCDFGVTEPYTHHFR